MEKKLEDVDWMKPKLELVNNSIHGVKLTLGETTRELDAEMVNGIIEHLETWLSWRDHWIHAVRQYVDYSIEQIKAELDDEEKGFQDADDEYRLGDDFSAYLETSSKNGKMADNNQAAKIIRKHWKEEFPEYEKDLVIDSEMSYCYIYTKKRDVAEKFLWWSYNKYKKPVIDLILNGVEK